MKIVVLDAATLTDDARSWAALQALGSVAVYPRSSPAEVEARARDASVLVTNKAPVTAAVLEQAPALRLIAVSATGYDCVDVAAAARRRVLVANVPEYGTNSVAELTFALLLALCRRVELHAEAVRAGQWADSPDFCFWKTPQVELAGKTLGIIGFGRIGRRVGELAHAFGMKVMAASRTRRAPPGYASFEWAEVDALFALADVITLHCPLSEQTVGLVHRGRLARVQPTCLLLNTARGRLVIAEDLAEALNAGRLAGAALDVVDPEPIAPDNPLLGARNCLLTPHIAWASQEARDRLRRATAANVESFLAGRPTNLVQTPGRPV